MYGKTSVTLTEGELFYLKIAVRQNIETVAEFVAGGDPHGVWQKELSELQAAYKKIERAIRRV